VAAAAQGCTEEDDEVASGEPPIREAGGEAVEIAAAEAALDLGQRPEGDAEGVAGAPEVEIDLPAMPVRHRLRAP